MKGSQNEGFICLYDLSIHHHFVQNIVCFLNVVHDVQLTHIFEVFVHCLHQIVNELQIRHFVLLLQIYAYNEVETGIAPVDNFVASVLDEGAEGLVSWEALADEFAFEGCPFFDGHFVVVLGESGLALFVDHEKEFNHALIYKFDENINKKNINCFLVIPK